MKGPIRVLLAGPTASGKSKLALAFAEKTQAIVVNADSQQVYDGWQVLSARPGPEDLARAEHRLYGHVPLEADYSAGAWLRDCRSVLAEAEGRAIIVVGGTGLYFKALTEGIAPIPLVPAALRRRGEAELEALGLGAFAEALAARDPATAAVLDMANPARVLRAWEVLEHTGYGLASWRARTEPALLPRAACRALCLAPPREWLYARCEARFDAMMAAGALEEVRAVQARGLAPSSPGLKALGAPELAAYLGGHASLEEAVAAAKTATRRYAKRQLTWGRNQMAAWQQIEMPLDAAATAVLAADLAGPG
ncbi:MAG: tRNA (adenosine(37)-N6)-dimethylallyltransferase MiaA [Pseudomonadota bacterium]